MSNEEGDLCCNELWKKEIGGEKAARRCWVFPPGRGSCPVKARTRASGTGNRFLSSGAPCCELLAQLRKATGLTVGPLGCSSPKETCTLSLEAIVSETLPAPCQSGGEDHGLPAPG